MKKINIDELVRPHILHMKPYSSARLEYEGNDGVFLDANENPYGSVSGGQHNRYPDPLQMQIKEKLAKVEQVREEQIFLGNGSDECIDVLVRAFCEPQKDAILVCPPVFSMYEHVAEAQNIDIARVLLQPETFQLDMPAIRSKIAEMPNLKIIFICSPNNPTGNLIHADDIEVLLQEFSGLVFVDEAYLDFSGQTTWVHRLQEFDNLVVIQTFSKSYGMADARLGILYAQERVVHFMNTIKLPYNVNQYSQELALKALDKISVKDQYVSELTAGRDYLMNELAFIPLVQKVYPSDANYILFRVQDANALYAYLIQHKIIVRNRDSAPLLKGCLRVSVGTEAENQRFISVLKQYSN